MLVQVANRLLKKLNLKMFHLLKNYTVGQK